MSDDNSPGFQIGERDLNQLLALVETSHNHVRKLIDLNSGLVSCVIDLMSGSSLAPSSPPQPQPDRFWCSPKYSDESIF